jgi:hypothetical protein
MSASTSGKKGGNEIMDDKVRESLERHLARLEEGDHEDQSAAVVIRAVIEGYERKLQVQDLEHKDTLGKLNAALATNADLRNAIASALLGYTNGDRSESYMPKLREALEHGRRKTDAIGIFTTTFKQIAVQAAQYGELERAAIHLAAISTMSIDDAKDKIYQHMTTTGWTLQTTIDYLLRKAKEGGEI